MSLVLAIDQSTSATKAILYSDEGQPIRKAALEHRQHYPRPGWVEHDAEEIWRNTLACIRQIVEADRAQASQIACLSITNQRETVVVFDRRTGRPLYPAIVWQCRRGQDICRQWQLDGADALVRRKTGLKIDPYFSASKLAWLMRNQASVADRLRSGEALIGTIDTYLVYRLTGGRVFATDHTNASRTMLFDIHELAWDQELCTLAGVPRTALPEVHDSTGSYGETDAGGAFDRQVPIQGVMGDSQAALFAHRCFAPGDGKATIGTGSSVLLNCGTKAVDGGDGVVTTIAWTHRGQAVYCLEGIINYSAATLTWLKDRLGLIQSLDECEPAAQSVEDNGGVYLVPAFAGLGAPYWSATARAGLVGMTAFTTRAHVIRAALESIAYQLDDVLTMMRRQGGVELQQLHVDGGGTANRFLMQFIADLTGVRLRAAAAADCSPLGAAMAGMLGLGIRPSLESLAGMSCGETVYNPAMPRRRANDLRQGWQLAVKQVLAGVRA